MRKRVHEYDIQWILKILPPEECLLVIRRYLNLSSCLVYHILVHHLPSLSLSVFLSVFSSLTSLLLMSVSWSSGETSCDSHFSLDFQPFLFFLEKKIRKKAGNPVKNIFSLSNDYVIPWQRERRGKDRGKLRFLFPQQEREESEEKKRKRNTHVRRNVSLSILFFPLLPPSSLTSFSIIPLLQEMSSLCETHTAVQLTEKRETE